MASVLKVDTIKSLTGNEAMTITESGVPLLNTQFCFAVIDEDTNLTSGVSTTVRINTRIHDPNLWLDTNTFKITPTIPGWYQVNASIFLGGTITRSQLRIWKNNEIVSHGLDIAASVPSSQTSMIVYLDGDDNVNAQIYATGSSLQMRSSTGATTTSLSVILLRGA